MSNTNTAVTLIVVLAPIALLILQLLSRKQAEANVQKLSQENGQIHILVNSRLEDALLRIKHLEEKLGLEPGDPIPHD